jgi:hypothetical protein
MSLIEFQGAFYYLRGYQVFEVDDLGEPGACVGKRVGRAIQLHAKNRRKINKCEFCNAEITADRRFCSLVCESDHFHQDG